MALVKDRDSTLVVKPITDIDTRKREAISLFEDVKYLLEKENLIDADRIVSGVKQNDVHAYFRIKGTSKAIHLHAFVQLSHEMYSKSDRNIITAGRLVDYNDIRRGHGGKGRGVSTEKIIYNQGRTLLDAQMIVDRIQAEWPA